MALALISAVSVSAQAFTNGSSDGRSAIETKVFKEINGLPYYGVFDHIAFKVDGGTVTLYGKVNSLGTKKSAERVVKKIPGVIEVVNNIEELPPSPFDNGIRRTLLRDYARTPGLYPYFRGTSPSVRIIVDRGRVTLEGYVADKGTSNLMYMIANQVPGTFGVTNNLVIEKAS